LQSFLSEDLGDVQIPAMIGVFFLYQVVDPFGGPESEQSRRLPNTMVSLQEILDCVD
jgi:hypothetical protein